jgi:TM2 domain-containing membrane protein YozV
MNEKYMHLLVGTILSWTLGFIGADRAYKGEITMAVLKLITFGGFGIWWLYDAYMWTKDLGAYHKGK